MSEAGSPPDDHFYKDEDDKERLRRESLERDALGEFEGGATHGVDIDPRASEESNPIIEEGIPKDLRKTTEEES